MKRTAALAVTGLLIAAAPAHSAVLRAPSGDYATIAAALGTAQAGDTVLVVRGTHAETLSLKKDVILEGEETAGTTLTGALTWAEGATLRRLTLKGGALTLDGQKGARAVSGTIENCIFRDTATTALAVAGARQSGASPSTLEIRRNTFFANGVALRLEDCDAGVSVTANAFSANDAALQVAATLEGDPAIASNHFDLDPADTATVTGTDVSSGDPSFLDPASSVPDLHVTADSLCVGRGAYSGPEADRTPGPVEDVGASIDAAGQATITWGANRAAGVDVARYRVAFRKDGLSVSYVELDSVQADGRDGTYTAALSVVPARPSRIDVLPRDGGLRVSWPSDERADGHLVYLSSDAADLGTPVDVGTAAQRDFDGLANGVPYYVAVSAYAEGARRFAVVAVPSDSSVLESRASEAPQVTLAARLVSDATDAVRAVPGALTGYPALDDVGGCFLAQAGRRSSAGPLAAAALGLAGAALAARRRRAGALLLAGAILASPLAPRPAEAGWAGGVAAGAFRPSQDDWADHYGKSFVPEGKVSVGYMPLPQIELGVDGGFRRDRGEVTTATTGEPLGTPVKQTLTVVPVQAYLQLNLRFADGQWVVPYAAAGYSRTYYRLEVDGNDTVKGHRGGYHARGGLKVRLDPLDPTNAANARGRYGVRGTYLLLEAQKTWVDDLGGVSYLGGVGLEF